MSDSNFSKYGGQDWIGKKYGYLTIVERNGNRFNCLCDCGREVVAIPALLIRGVVKSCGKNDCVYHKSLIQTHGLSKDRIYRIWSGMRARCYNQKSHAWWRYGGRGIDICDEWRDDVFAFREWALSHGYRDDLTIDRIDNDRGYYPDNCRWATETEQANNQHKRYTFTPRPGGKARYKRKLNWEIDGVKKSAIEWCEDYGLSVPFVMYRINKMGMSPKEALTTPKSSKGRPKSKS